MWISGLPVQDANQFFVISALLMAPAALATAYLLARMARWRALMWAAAPALALYAFHNWDLLVVIAAVGGIWSWSRGRHEWAAVGFGVGAAFKMYPIFFLAPLFLYLLKKGGFVPAMRAVGAGVLTFALINLPFALANPDGWYATYEFHRDRGPNFDNMWNLAFPSDTWAGTYEAMTPAALNLVTALLTGAFFTVALAYGWRRARKDGMYPFVQVCAALLASFLLWNKVHSPQYALWLLPFFVLVRVNVAWWVAYGIADWLAYYGIFQWFYDSSQGQDFTTAKKMMIAGVWGRALLLMLLFAIFLRARGVVEEPEPLGEPANLSHPPATVPT